MDDLISLLGAMSYDPKDRIQVAMLYRKEPTPAGPVWKNFGVARVRACQGHSIPWILLERLGVSIQAEHVGKLACLCHGTTHDALPNILRGSLKPASHVDPSQFRQPGSRSQRPATGKPGGVTYGAVRNVLMMSPYPYFDKWFLGGARKASSYTSF